MVGVNPVAPSSLKLSGEKQSGESVRVQNTRAATGIAAVIQSSFGPIGLDKMMVDDLGQVTISNDGATILKNLDVQHPAAKVLIQLSELQDREVGDGTTTVVLLAAELLRSGHELIDRGVHPNTVIGGFRQAAKCGIAFLKKWLSVSAGTLERPILLNVAATSMASKILHGYASHFAPLIVDACLAIFDQERGKCPVSRINVVKSLGRSLPESKLLAHGLALNARRAADAMPRKIENCRVAVLDLGIARTRLGMGIQFRLKDGSNLSSIQKEEVNQAKRAVEAMLSAGANVIVTSKQLEEVALKPLVRAGAIGIRHVSNGEINALAKATGATVVRELTDEEGNFAFKSEWLGTAAVCEQEDIGDNEMIVFSGCGKERSASIILRGPNTYALDEANRTIRDCLSAVKRVLESKHISVGGGCAETGVSVAVEKASLQVLGKEQAAWRAFADSMLVIPKILARNAALDAIELVARLRHAHFEGQEKGEKCFACLDLYNGGIQNGFDAGIVEPAVSRVKSIQFATEAAITILRIDDLIRVLPDKKREGGEEGGEE